MNQIAWQIFGGSKSKANTFIGGVASTITTSGALATKLGIASNRITNFKIVGSDIECRISGSYAIPNSAFQDNTDITYYRDYENCTSIGVFAFYHLTSGLNFKLYDLYFENALTIGSDICQVVGAGAYPLKKAIFPKATTFLGQRQFFSQKEIETVYIPMVTVLGSTLGNNQIFDFTNYISQKKLYCHPSLATNNAGAPDGDITNAIANGWIVRYVTNFTAPSPITNLSVGTTYGTAVQLNFTAPTGSTNAIDYYECYANGVYKNTITGSGQYITGLNLNTTYNIELKPVDILYNKSTSNLIAVTTANISYTDTDANAYISAATLTSSEQESAYQLITDLKTAGLWTKIQALYPFKGTTAAQHKWNAKNPLDTNAAFRLTFTGAATFSNLGYQLNGSSYANTFFVPSAQQSVNSNGITVVCGTNNSAFSGDVIEVGAFNSGSQRAWVGVKNNNTNYSRNATLNATAIAQTGVNEARGIFTGVRQSSTVTDLFVNGTQVATGNSGGTLPTVSASIGCMNLNSTPYGYSNQRIQIAIIHEGLTDAEVATLHSIIDLSEVIAGRKTW